VIFYQNMPNLHNRYISAERPNFDGIVIGWSSSKMVSGSCALPPRWPPQCSCVVIESSFDRGERLQAPGSLWCLVQPSWSEGGTTRHSFGRVPSNDYVIKVWFQFSNWLQIRRCLCEFPIDDPLPKLCSAVAFSHQDGRSSAVALLLKAALIEVRDYRLLGASGV
jgi:hypothetical protein